MKNAAILTDIELRAHWYRTQEKSYTVAPDTCITPAALDFIREHQIQLNFAAPSSSGDSMTVTPIPNASGRARYVDYATGKPLDSKPENMTHLRGNLLVSKQHPRIALRGRFDSLMAKLIRVQLKAAEAGREKLAADLEELLAYLRAMLAAEVKDEPLKPIRLLGLSSEEIRSCSHHVKEHFGINHPIPSYRMGKLCVALNELRTQVRETELCAVNTFAQDDPDAHLDIIEGLNRLSSCVYILFCRVAAGYYEEGK